MFKTVRFEKVEKENLTSGRGICVVRPGDEVRTVFGVGDKHRYLATGEHTDGQYFLVEAIVPLGGGHHHIFRYGRKRPST